MIFDKNIASETAKQLLQINAIKLNPENPFTWASGWKSPIYCDNRIILSFPVIRNFIRERMVKAVDQLYGKPEAIVGVATGAIGIGILVAEALNLPFAYVRPEPKGHGRQNQIEGHLESGQKVVVIEDLISTGGSSLKATEALQNHGLIIKGMLAIFSYGFEIAIKNFEQANVNLNTLSNYNYLIETAVTSGYINENQIATLKLWRENPSLWKS